MPQTLTIDEIEVARPPMELYDWCTARIESLAQEGETERMRLRKGLYKELLEEVYPLAVWSKHSRHLGPNCTITPVIGSQRFDALVVDPSNSPNSYHLEVTQAHMGQSEHFRMLHINAEGWAPGCPSRKYVLPDILDLFQRRRQSDVLGHCWDPEP